MTDTEQKLTLKRTQLAHIEREIERLESYLKLASDQLEAAKLSYRPNANRIEFQQMCLKASTAELAIHRCDQDILRTEIEILLLTEAEGLKKFD